MSWIAEGTTGDIVAAIEDFHKMLPGWWFSVGVCHVSADATVAPDRAGMDADLLKFSFFDEGFDVDLRLPATMADALRQATSMAWAARDAYYVRNRLEDAEAAIETLAR